jgi:two-component system sensor histidine kinase KdpD
LVTWDRDLVFYQMSDSVTLAPSGAGARLQRPSAASSSQAPMWARYALSALFVGLATVLAFVVEHLIAAPNLTLVYVLPVIAAAALFGWGPSLLAVVASVAAFDFFFTVPYHSFAIANPSDIWAAAMLLVVAAVVTSIAAESRRRAIEANRAAERASALQALAHIVIEGAPQLEVLRSAATALSKIFLAPAAVFMESDGRVRAVATAGGAEATRADEEAAEGALGSHLVTRGESYPYDRTYFDLWPVSTGSCRCVLGIDFAHAEEDRPAAPERFVDVVAGYLAAALGKAA